MTTTVYQCDICKSVHATLRAAAKCEAQGVINQQPKIKPGMIVLAGSEYGFLGRRQPNDWTVQRTAAENVKKHGYDSHLTNLNVLDMIYVVVGFAADRRYPHEGVFQLVSLGHPDQPGVEDFRYNTGPKSHHRMTPLDIADHPAVAAEILRLMKAYRDKQSDVLL